MQMLGQERCGVHAHRGCVQRRAARQSVAAHAAAQSAELANEPEVMIRRRPPEGKARQPCAHTTNAALWLFSSTHCDTQTG